MTDSFVEERQPKGRKPQIRGSIGRVERSTCPIVELQHALGPMTAVLCKRFSRSSDGSLSTMMIVQVRLSAGWQGP